MPSLGIKKKENPTPRVEKLPEHLPQLTNEMQLSIMNMVKSGELSIEDALDRAKVDRLLLRQKSVAEEKQEPSQHNFSVHKSGRYRWQKRVLQIDFRTRMLSNIEKGIIKRHFPFSLVKSCDDGVGSRFSISFKGHHDYELEALSLQDKQQIMRLVNQIIYENIYQDPLGDEVETQPQGPQSLREGVLLLHRGGLASFKWLKYEAKLHPGQLTLKRWRPPSDSDLAAAASAPIVIHLSHGDTTVQKHIGLDTFTLITHKNEYQFKVPRCEQSSVQGSVQKERDSWVRSIHALCKDWKRKSMCEQMLLTETQILWEIDIDEDPEDKITADHDDKPWNANVITPLPDPPPTPPPTDDNHLSEENKSQRDPPVPLPKPRLKSLDDAGSIPPPTSPTDHALKSSAFPPPSQVLPPPPVPPPSQVLPPPPVPPPSQVLPPPPVPPPSQVLPPPPVPPPSQVLPPPPVPPPSQVLPPPPVPPPSPLPPAPPSPSVYPPVPASSSHEEAPPVVIIPPPPPPPLSLKLKALLRKPRTKAFHWDLVSSDKIGKSFWKQENSRRIVIDAPRLFEQFAVKAVESVIAAEPCNTQHIMLNEKIAHNFNIFLKSFSVQPEELKDKLYVIKEEDGGLSDGHITSLRRYVPTLEDVEMYKSHKGPVAELHIVDQYMMAMCNIPYLSTQLDLLLTLRELPITMKDLQPLIKQKIRMCTQLYGCRALVSVLEYLLAIGNYLNENAGKEKAKGFRLSSLTKLSQLRSSDRKFTLLHALVEQILIHEPTVATFTKDMEEFETVPGASIKGLTAEVDVLKNELQKVIQYKKVSKKRSSEAPPPTFSKDLKAFIDKNNTDLSALTQSCEEMRKLYSLILVKFGEAADQDSQELFGRICHFIQEFKRAKMEMI